MYYLDYAKQVGDRWILNFFADAIEDLKDVPTNTPYITRNGTNYGIPLDTSVVTIVEKGVKVNYVLQQGKYIAGGDVAPVVAAKDITENGTYLAKDEQLDGFSSVTVNVEPNLQEKSQVPNANPVEVVPDEGFEGLSKVTVEAIPADYIIPNGTKTITTNGEADIRAFAKVDINVEPKLQAKTQAPGAAAVTVKPDANYDGLSQVTVNAIPVETKSATPTKNAQTITPSEGKFLSQVTVAAIPADYIIPTGTKSVTANGAADVKEFEQVNVNVQPKLQEKATTVNGPVVADAGYDGLSKVTVSVATPTEEKTVELALSAGDQVVTPATGKHLSKVTITKPATLLPENIKKGVVIAGVTGTYEAATTE